mmetsp:Transcript_49425/g.120644  ORF Transcript_49425/g.120644 Transcript_49425/m.120644 type:complete len:301 (-) Transcript_49425:16-918(-)
MLVHVHLLHVEVLAGLEVHDVDVEVVLLRRGQQLSKVKHLPRGVEQRLLSHSSHLERGEGGVEERLPRVERHVSALKDQNISPCGRDDGPTPQVRWGQVCEALGGERVLPDGQIARDEQHEALDPLWRCVAAPAWGDLGERHREVRGHPELGRREHRPRRPMPPNKRPIHAALGGDYGVVVLDDGSGEAGEVREEGLSPIHQRFVLLPCCGRPCDARDAQEEEERRGARSGRVRRHCRAGCGPVFGAAALEAVSPCRGRRAADQKCRAGETPSPSRERVTGRKSLALEYSRGEIVVATAP